MKSQWLASLISASLVSLLSGVNLAESQETQETKFICGAWRETPMTVAQTPRGNIPIVYWVSDWVNDSSSDLTPQRRCETVSENFQQAYDRGELQYITTGVKNGQNIVCVAQEENGPCVSQLFTLKPGSDPTESVKQLMNIGDNYASDSGGPLYQSSGAKRLYINFEDFLNQAKQPEP
ncbi:COP23 domain-containing protein [Waterburya agarophytonicola K14]|uniref:COP23 domain-containing protein n=1 Tax=Waterburya agarophytonicola KI4 TaxID=2874699 RepID=A0A964BUJ8_9CYAN|nr:COP23 domain-containing protein [Waterburya agarophytonicola]MCC0178778.1 COP23 domain-containing protein [Waterburya agarophytonicola KI4]